MAEIALLGHGVVGSGVMDVIYDHRGSLKERAKEKIHVKYILDIRDFPELPYAKKFTRDFNKILNDDEIRIVVEVMGGLTPAYEYVKACLENGKSVVTSNKELVAEKGAELLKIARDNNLNFLFEASVGGGIPIIRPISQCLAANDVTEIAGILNGTTNFILTKMIRENISFDDALKTAQELGYAERDPSADVDGEDACRKICILASLAFGTHVYPKEVDTQGIREISLVDVEYAKSWGGVIKLIGDVRKLDNGQINIIVCPMLVSSESQLAHVDDVFNGILVRGDATGDVVFYGKGAGKLPTASAVVADVIDCVKHFNARKYLFWEDAKEGYVAPLNDYESAFFVRFDTDDIPGLMKQIRESFENPLRIARKDSAENEVGFITAVMTRPELDKALGKIDGSSLKSVIRVSDF